MKFTLSNGLAVEQVERDGLQFLECSGNPDKVLTESEWLEAAGIIVTASRKRLADERQSRIERNRSAFRAKTEEQPSSSGTPSATTLAGTSRLT